MRPFPPWLAAGIGLLVGVVLVMLLLRVPPPRSAAPSAPSLPEPAPAPAPPPFEAFEEAPRQGMPARAPRTGIALIVDDLGNNRREAIAVAELPGRFAASVLPDAPQARFAARTLAAAGKIVMLHLPMEPKVAKYRARMDGFFLTLADDDAAIAEKLARALAVVPEAQGVNNHMGSALTERWAPMRALMRGIAGRRLFFVDSLT
ncbi:MAG: divergent polysaccharide deacetylase family protein, partial [Zetaproteobacteria bacterium]